MFLTDESALFIYYRLLWIEINENICFIGMHKTSMYTTYNLFNLNICDVCGSYQCSSCPYYNSTQNIPGFTTTDTVLPSSTSRQNISNIIKHVTTAKPVSRSTCLSSTIISLLTLITFLMHLVWFKITLPKANVVSTVPEQTYRPKSHCSYEASWSVFQLLALCGQLC